MRILLSLCLVFIRFTNSLNFSKRTFFATTVPGLENLLHAEVLLLPQVSNVVVKSAGVEFSGSTLTGLEALMWLRTSLKLMEKLVGASGLKTREDLYSLCAKVNWEDLIDVTSTIKCDTILGQENPKDLTHTHFSSLTIKNAIVDRFRESLGKRPSVDTLIPDLSLLVYLHKGTGVLYRIWSGEDSMHKRGYRDRIHKAALRETTAAAM
jgi:23S rRNA G2445 N2-methylase RlmL